MVFGTRETCAESRDSPNGLSERGNRPAGLDETDQDLSKSIQGNATRSKNGENI